MVSLSVCTDSSLCALNADTLAWIYTAVYFKTLLLLLLLVVTIIQSQLNTSVCGLQLLVYETLFQDSLIASTSCGNYNTEPARLSTSALA
jgi:hypothetical protein